MIVADGERARALVEDALQVRIWEPFSGLTMWSDGKLTGACIFNNYDGRDVHFTCVQSGLLGMREARFVAKYVFGTLGCHRCTAVTRRGNDAARKALEQLGFRVEGCLRQHFVDDDGICYGLLRSEQRIVRLANGRSFGRI